jgi:hypothetical protein
MAAMTPTHVSLRRRALHSPLVVAMTLAVAAAVPLRAEPPAPVTAPPAPVPAKADRAPEIRLTGETVTLPIVMVREFPFIEARIAGVSGKLMLDTGIEGALTVNDHRVPVKDARTIGTGFFGSGQTFAIRLAHELRDIRIGGLRYPRATQVDVQDARMLEGITPDFIGWFGYNAFAGHAMKLDYRALRATFYRHGGADYLKGERVIAQLPFETRKLPNHPILPGRIGTMPVVTTWDTGQNGTLYTSEAGKARLLKEGRLVPHADDPDLFDLHGLELDGHAMPVVRGIDIEMAPSPAAKPTGITEPDELTIGYALLHQFKTVWDYDRKRIYLLAR